MNSQLFSGLGIAPAEIYLPRPATDMRRWAMVACDQYTSLPSYWREMDEYVGGAPSTLRLIIPEAFLDTPEENALRLSAAEHMRAYLDEGVLRPLEAGFIYVRRATPFAPLRQGLVAAFDLEAYDYRSGSASLIRSTEETIAERLPARVSVRRQEALECPHIMVLIDDPAMSVIEPLGRCVASCHKVYDTGLAGEGGSIAGYHITGLQAFESIARGLRALKEHSPMLYAVGDGNHSLAAALKCWQEIKKALPWEEAVRHPLRYCLAEIVNIHDPGLLFHPIHRVLYTQNAAGIQNALCERLRPYMAHTGNARVLWGKSSVTFALPEPAALFMQRALDDILQTARARIDYIHEEEHCRKLALEGNVAVLLPPMDKYSLFPAVARGGVLPRKTFSMGHAQEKRYYMECRRLI